MNMELRNLGRDRHQIMKGDFVRAKNTGRLMKVDDVNVSHKLCWVHPAKPRDPSENRGAIWPWDWTVPASDLGDLFWVYGPITKLEG